MTHLQIVFGIGLGYCLFEYYVNAGEVVFIVAAGIAGIAIVYELEQ